MKQVWEPVSWMFFKDQPILFRYNSDKRRWEKEVWPIILMYMGPPPAGVKFYGEGERMHIRSKAAQKYVTKLLRVFKASIFDETSTVSHYSTHWKQNRALHMKNLYLRWWHDFSKEEG